MPVARTWDPGAASSEGGWATGGRIAPAEPPTFSDDVSDLLLDDDLVFSDAAAADLDHDPLAHFAQSNHFEHLLRDVIAAVGIKLERPTIAILAAGTGANGVSPCLRLFPAARLVAAERDRSLLARLKAHLRESGALGRVTMVEAAADQSFLQPGKFDLLVGVGALNTLADPDRAIAAAARALRPGGRAIFMEPFDGYGVLRVAFSRILAEGELQEEKLDEEVQSALLSLIADIAARTAPDPTAPDFAGRGQKWLFARESLAAAATNLGFSSARFFAHNDHASLYRDLGVLRVAERVGGASPKLPSWALAVLDQFDQALTPAVKRLLMVEGTMVLTR